LKRSLAIWAALTAAALLAACRGTTDLAAERDAGPHSGDCAACHQAEFNGVTHPLHPGKKPTTCAVCHRTDSWSPSILKHAWTLEGAHLKADCFLCHQGSPPVFEGTSEACDDCHRPEFDKENAKNPAHARNGIECETCHSPTGWKPAHRPLAVAPVVTAAPAITAAPTTPTTPKSPVVKPTPKPVVTPTPTVTPPPSPKALPRPDIPSGASSRR
jgi:hypothetical protein